MATEQVTTSTRSNATAILRDQLNMFWKRALAGYAEAPEAPDTDTREA